VSANESCPDAAKLADLLQGSLPEGERAGLWEHLEACAACQAAIEPLVEGNASLEALSRDLKEATESGGAALDEALDRLKSQEPPDVADGPEEDDSFEIDFLDDSSDPDSLGRLDAYEIREVIGRGGMGLVLRGHDPKLNRVVAIKVLAPQLAASAPARKRFLREARAAAAVNHLHVVGIFAIQEGKLPYLAMEYVDGESLQQKINAEGPLELKEILRIGMQIAAGLGAAHEQGLIHRDVKPSNVLLENGVERVKLTDFGLARAVDDISITRTGEVAGTPEYMSPEQADAGTVDPRSDLFSLGSVLYAMCTGRSPFRAESTMRAMRRVCEDRPRPIREVNPDAPPWLADLIDKLLEKDPSNRIQTAAEVEKLLGSYLAHVQDPSGTSLPRPVFSRQRKRRSRPWLVVVATVLLLAGSLGLTEATGVTHVAATVIRIATGEGTLVIEVDDPKVEISLDGEELSITGAGIEQLKLRPGQYHFRATKDGKPVKQELVSITRGGRELIRIKALIEPDTEEKGKPSPPLAVAPFLPEEARRHQQRWAEYLGVPVEIENSIGMKMVLIPPGEYDMSVIPFPNPSDFLEKNGIGGNRGKVTLRVAVREPFRISSCEVAVAQFRRFVEGAGYVTAAEKTEKGGAVPSPSESPRAFETEDRDSPAGPLCWKDPGFPQDENHPVVHVSWNDAVAFCRWLSAKEGRTYRLPSNAEWEYTCRAGTNTKFYTGEAETSLRGAANVLDKSAQRIAGYKRVGPRYLALWDDGHPFTSPVASFEPNAFGLYDMHGNVWERCEEVPYRSDGAPTIARGGAHDTPVRHASCDYAIWFPTAFAAWTIGFRVVAPIEVSSNQIDGGSSEHGAEEDAFVIFNSHGSEVAKFDTLAEAVSDSNSGDTIEIRGNGPFFTDPIDFCHPLAIRAADGFRSVIQANPKITLTHDLPLLDARDLLVLEGLDVRTSPAQPVWPCTRAGCTRLLFSRGAIRAANCRLFFRPDVTGGPLEGKSDGDLRNCLLVGDGAVCWSAISEGRLSIQNCIVVGGLYPSFGAERDATFQLVGSTALRANRIHGLLNPRVYDASQSVLDTGAPNRLQIVASSNILDWSTVVLQFQVGSKPEASFDVARAEELLPRMIHWRGERNLFRQGRTFFDFSVDYKKTIRETERGQDLADWRRFWGLADTKSFQGAICYQADDLHTKAIDTPEQLTPEDFRLRPDSAGYQAGPDGKDLGADVDLVGPGEAYERWKETPEYEQWQKETQELLMNDD
jgi:serine/threonine protein kinase/formylglycine-generating enzyme required for sulfatase activity